MHVYWQVIPGAHGALNVPCAVTEAVPPATSVPVKLKVPRTDDGEDL